MKLTNLTFKNLLEENPRLTFLVGAGCSIDAPACLPAGRPMMEAIINYSCAEAERVKILKIKNLRFEQLVEFIRDKLDPELKLLDFYGECTTPNTQHFALAEMVKHGQFVITTNFDFLLENALEQMGVPRNEIVPVITRDDFEKYGNPNTLWAEGKKAVYKIHGSKRNCITGESTNRSLIATMQSFGAGKEGESVFQLEPFKRPAFEHLSAGRTLVVVGYSGSDDFDIVPTLRVLKGVKSIIWFQHLPGEQGPEKIYEVDGSSIPEGARSDKVDHILGEIWRSGNAERVFRGEAHTARLLGMLLGAPPRESTSNFVGNPTSWFAANLRSPSEFDTYYIPLRIYYQFNMYPDARRCADTLLSLAEKRDDPTWKATTHGYLGMIDKAQGNYDGALRHFVTAMQINEQSGNHESRAFDLNFIGNVLYAQANYPAALRCFEEALQIAEQLGDLEAKAARLNNIGMILEAQGNLPAALQHFEAALHINEQLGSLEGKSINLHNIGRICEARGDYPAALQRQEAALQIAEQMGNLSSQATYKNSIGLIYVALGNTTAALQRFEAALRIDEQIGNLEGKASRINNIGGIYMQQKNYPAALQRFEEALRIDEQTGNLASKAEALNNIGGIYLQQKNYTAALPRFEAALQINEQLGNLKGKATDLNNLGMIHQAHGNSPAALKSFEAALQIGEQLENLVLIINVLGNIGAINHSQGDYPAALRSLERVLHILNINGLGGSPHAKALEKDIETVRESITH